MPNEYQYDVSLGHSAKDKATAPSSSMTSPDSNSAPPTADRLLTYPPPHYGHNNQRTPLHASRFTHHVSRNTQHATRPLPAHVTRHSSHSHPRSLRSHRQSRRTFLRAFRVPHSAHRRQEEAPVQQAVQHLHPHRRMLQRSRRAGHAHADTPVHQPRPRSLRPLLPTRSTASADPLPAPALGQAPPRPARQPTPGQPRPHLVLSCMNNRYKGRRVRARGLQRP